MTNSSRTWAALPARKGMEADMSAVEEGGERISESDREPTLECCHAPRSRRELEIMESNGIKMVFSA